MHRFDTLANGGHSRTREANAYEQYLFHHDNHSPIDLQTGRPRKDDSAIQLAVKMGNFNSSLQLYLEIEGAHEPVRLHLTKQQAKKLAESLTRADQTIAYDNSV